MASKSCPTAKFAKGDKVQHAACADGSFPADCGVVECVEPYNDCSGSVYKVRCDTTGNVLPVVFKESELTKKC